MTEHSGDVACVLLFTAVGVGEAANFASFGLVPAVLVTTLGALSVIVR